MPSIAPGPPLNRVPDRRRPLSRKQGPGQGFGGRKFPDAAVPSADSIASCRGLPKQYGWCPREENHVFVVGSCGLSREAASRHRDRSRRSLLLWSRSVVALASVKRRQAKLYLIVRSPAVSHGRPWYRMAAENAPQVHS
jgi:hypothetical protein